MSIRKTILSVALLGAFAASAFAGSGTDYVSERGEATYSGPMPAKPTHPMPGAKTRAEVVREVQNAGGNDALGYVGDYPKSWGVATGGNPAMSSSRSRESVLQELQAFRRNPVTHDGYRVIDGEIGYVYVGRQTFNDLPARAAR